MGRAEKRRMDRTEMWFDSLAEDKKQIIHGIIQEKIDSNNNMMTAISDICTVCALDDVLDVNISKIKDVISRIKFYLIDYGEYLEKEKDGGIDMIDDQEMRAEVKSKIRTYMKGKMDKSRGLKLLKNEFNLPYGELSDLWLECKNGNYTKEKDRVPENMTQHEEPKAETAADQDDVKNLISKGIEQMNNDPNQEPENNTKPEKKISLRVVNVTTEVEGEYGTYIKNVDGVKIGDSLYSDKDMVKKEKIKLASNYNIKMDEVRDKIKELNLKLKNIQDSGMKEIERFTEIESVFDL